MRSKRDINIISRPLENAPVRLSFGQLPFEIRGPEKLVQIYVVVLFTAPGSKLINKEMGTPLGEALKSIVNMSIEHITNLFNIANIEALDFIKADQINLEQEGVFLPKDEKLREARIIEVRVLDKTTIRVQIQLITESDKIAEMPFEVRMT